MILLETFGKVLVDLNIASSVGGKTTWSVFFIVQPEAPVRCITLYETPIRVRTVNDATTGALIEYRESSIQVRVRHPDVDQAIEKQREIEYNVNRTGPWTTTDAEFVIEDLLLQTSASAIGRDPRNNHIVLSTWRALVTRYTDAVVS